MNKKIITLMSMALAILMPLNNIQGSMVDMIDSVATYYKNRVDTTNATLSQKTTEVKDAIESSFKKYKTDLQHEYNIPNDDSSLIHIAGLKTQANNDIDLLLKTANDPLKKKYAELTKQLKKQLTQIDNLLNPAMASLSGGKTLKAMVEELVNNAKKRAAYLAERACLGKIKNGEVDPETFNINPVKVFKTFVPRKDLKGTEDFIKTIKTKLLILFNPYASDPTDATNDFPKTTGSPLWPLNQEFLNILNTAERKKRESDASSIFGTKQSDESRAKTNALIEGASAPYTNSIKKLKSDITSQINTYYNNIVNQINACLEVINNLLNPSNLNSLKKTIASALFDTSVGSISKDAFDTAATEAIKKYNNNIAKIQNKFESGIANGASQARANAATAARKNKQDIDTKAKQDAIKKQKEDKDLADLEIARAKLAEENAKKAAERQAQAEIDAENGITTYHDQTDGEYYDQSSEYDTSSISNDSMRHDSTGYESNGYESDGYSSGDDYTTTYNPVRKSNNSRTSSDNYGLEDVY